MPTGLTNTNRPHLWGKPGHRRGNHFVDCHDGVNIGQARFVVCWQSSLHIALVLLKALGKGDHILQA